MGLKKSARGHKTSKNIKNNQKSTNQSKTTVTSSAISITKLAEKLNDTELNKQNYQINQIDQIGKIEQIEKIEHTDNEDSCVDDNVKITSKSKKSNKSTKTTKSTKSDIESVVSNDESVQQVVVKPKGKLTLTSMRVVTTWEYDVDNSECTLCHRDLMVPIPVTNTNINTQTKNSHPRYENDVSVGTCHHGYHVSCINSWVKSGNNCCPKCKTPWKTDKNVSSSVYVYPK